MNDDSFDWMIYSSFELFRESLDSPVGFSKNIRGDHEEINQVGSFKIDNITFNYNLEFQKEDRELRFSFNQEINGEFSLDDENNLEKKQVFSVFSTIKEILEEYVEISDYILLEPTTKKKFQVYISMARKLAPEFDIIPKIKYFEIEMFRRKKISETREVRIIKEPKKNFKYLKS